jgi:uncharacterized protein YhbP (UPF0306 family)
MRTPDPRILKFIKSHSVLTLATSFGDEPYCANLFYSFLPEDACLVITSDMNTRHIRNISHNIFVAGSIVDTCSMPVVKGIQFQGVISEPSQQLAQKALDIYQKQFPFTVGMDTTLWVIDLTFLKFTDSSLGFGKKLIWKK